MENKKKKLVKEVVSETGFAQVELIDKDGVGKLVSVHHLVATAFVPNPGNKKYVNHIDGNKLNNRADNLEWVDEKDNLINN